MNWNSNFSSHFKGIAKFCSSCSDNLKKPKNTLVLFLDFMGMPEQLEHWNSRRPSWQASRRSRLAIKVPHMSPLATSSRTAITRNPVANIRPP